MWSWQSVGIELQQCLVNLFCLVVVVVAYHVPSCPWHVDFRSEKDLFRGGYMLSSV